MKSRVAVLLVAIGLSTACSVSMSRRGNESGAQPAISAATISQIYAWRAKPGRFDEYTHYIRDVAEPIDREAQRAGAFISVTTFAVNDSTVPWTHLRVFLLRDSTQLRGLSDALTAAGVRLQPDSVMRRQQSEYSATLRDRVSASVAQIVR